MGEQLYLERFVLRNKDFNHTTRFLARDIIMKKLLVLITIVLLSGCASAPRLTTIDLSKGMSRQEVLLKFGQPVNATISNGIDFLIYEFNDHA